MNSARTVASVAALCLALGATGTLAASASAPATVMGCIDMSKKVSAALGTAQQSATVDAARAAQGVARDYCARHMYQEGVSRYAKALELLGAG